MQSGANFVRGLAMLTLLAGTLACVSETVVTPDVAERSPVPTWTVPVAPSDTPVPTATQKAPPSETHTAVAATTTQSPALPTLTPLPEGISLAFVTHVVDGDTIDVEMGGQTFRVRYIGVNTPESNETCGDEATTYNARLVEGQTVRLVKDVSETDQFGRLLRYVYVGEVFVNARLVSEGYAEAVEYPPDTAQADYLEGLEKTARAAQLNCYATGIFGGLPTATRPPRPTATKQVILPTQSLPQPTQPPPVGNCDPSYPTVCIPPPPPDLDCGDIPFRRFQVLPPDPHRFDRDNDGIGCES